VSHRVSETKNRLGGPSRSSENYNANDVDTAYRPLRQFK
jgi:hypothetical protein